MGLGVLAGAWLATWPATGRAQSDATEFDGWTRFDTAGAAGARPSARPRPGLLLMGGAGRNEDAFRWLAERAGGGRLLILAARGGPWRAEWLSRLDVGFGRLVTAVTTARSAASDPALLAAVREADAVLLSGGAQGTYLHLWRDTPLQAALQRHVVDGKPLAGLSAGLAMMGEWCFSAARGSVSARRVLADPFDDAVTLEPGLLALPPLAGILTDSHFSERDRLGRLAGFLVRLHCAGRRGVVGLGVDERTSLALADGRGQVFSDDGGAVHRVSVQVPDAACTDWPAARDELRVAVETAAAGTFVDWPWTSRGGRPVAP